MFDRDTNRLKAKILVRIWLFQRLETSLEAMSEKLYPTVFPATQISQEHKEAVTSLWADEYISVSISPVKIKGHVFYQADSKMGRLTAKGLQWILENWQEPTVADLKQTPIINMNHDNELTTALKNIWRLWENEGVAILSGNEEDLLPYVVDDLIAYGFVIPADKIQSVTTPLQLTQVGYDYMTRHMLPFIMLHPVVDLDKMIYKLPVSLTGEEFK